jgi:hypothetical protein
LTRHKVLWQNRVTERQKPARSRLFIGLLDGGNKRLDPFMPPINNRSVNRLMDNIIQKSSQCCKQKFEQLSLFSKDRLPHRPYCSPEKGAHLIRPVDKALQFPYLQVNSSAIRWWMVFDIDRQGAALAWDDANLPPPAWSATDPESTKGHIAYGLDVPVVTTDAARAHPIRYLRHVEYGMALALGADLKYSGLITKNPLHKNWKVWQGPQHGYTLDEIAEYIEIPKKIPKKAAELGVGRNVDTFEHVRKWAYCHVMQAKRTMLCEAWVDACITEAETFNAGFKNPMLFSECKAIGKSVGRWTWRNFGTGEYHARFIERQAAKGVKSGAARLAKNEDKRASARLMKASGKSVRQIALELDVSIGSVSAWCSGVQ